MTSDAKPVGILGGTFDPVHHGHLRAALELLDDLDLHEIRFIPCRQPPHRNQPQASPSQRRSMLGRAIAGQIGFVLDDREMQRAGPSYMTDTLISLRRDFGERRPLCLIVGRDAFAELESWYRWREILDLTHIVVPLRPGTQPALSAVLDDLVARRHLGEPATLRARCAGGILFRPITQLDISATAIRALLARGRSARYLMPEPVLSYIHEHGLYQRV